MSANKPAKNGYELNCFWIDEAKNLTSNELTRKVVISKTSNETTFTMEDPAFDLQYKAHQEVMEWYFKSR